MEYLQVLKGGNKYRNVWGRRKKIRQSKNNIKVL